MHIRTWVLCFALSLIAGMAMAQALDRRDADFLKQAAQAGLAEVEGSKLAVSKGVNTQVKGFAQQMVDDHTKAGSELAALAASKGVTLPTELTVAQKAKLELLSSRDGGSFDRNYANTLGVGAHRDTLRLFQKAAGSSRDADVKAFAAKALPTLQHHFEMAQELKGVVDKEGNAKAAGDRKQ
ncbi:MAG TPA: DUF4142 domain-containing protein [Albitalea sp.]|uniref:DUF4142 domain-containing protein n=1 Tax=Piscinibacter sp. TaxID=1903157 RepID=UPI002ED01BE9